MSYRYPDLLIFATFLFLSAFSLFHPRERKKAWTRTWGEWFVDSFSLGVQGILIPALQYLFVYQMYQNLFPEWKGILELPFWCGFLLHFVVIDYGYYWNHRLFHSQWFWNLHRLHHSAKQFDLWITSRNTLLAPFFILYLWCNPFCLFLLADPSPFLLAMACTASLDLWRHTTFGPKAGSVLHRLMQKVLITPHEHHLHHSSTHFRKNYGANFSLWDRLHSTYHTSVSPPKKMGVPLKRALWKEWLFPYP